LDCNSATIFIQEYIYIQLYSSINIDSRRKKNKNKTTIGRKVAKMAEANTTVSRVKITFVGLYVGLSVYLWWFDKY